MKLYEIDQAILECIDQETGDIVDIDRLEALEVERDQKVSNVACWIKNLKAEAEAIKAEKQNLAKRQTADENKIKQLKSWLDYALNGTTYKDARCAVSYRKSSSVEVAEGAIENLPEEYVKVTKEAKLTELKTALDLGYKFDGIELVEKSNIQVR